MASEALLRTETSVGTVDRVPVILPDLAAAAHVDLGLLSRSLAFQVRNAQLTLQRRRLRNPTGISMGMAEFGALVLCERNPGLAQFQIAAALDIDKASVVAIVDRLEELGWVLRRRSNHDRRRYCLYLTPAGAQQAQMMRNQNEEAEAFAQEIFSPEELNLLLGLLARIA
jgi:DNA-binding MarR family transcriptional regulator